MKQYLFASLACLISLNYSALAATRPSPGNFNGATPISKEFSRCVDEHIAQGYVPIYTQEDFEIIRQNFSTVEGYDLNYVIASPYIQFTENHTTIGDGRWGWYFSADGTATHLDFAGDLEGCNAVIADLHVTDYTPRSDGSSIRAFSLFGATSGHIRNLRFVRPHVSTENADANDPQEAAVLSTTLLGPVENVRITDMSVISRKSAGGIVANLFQGGSIADSYASGLIAGHEYVGGLVGYSTRAIDRSAARVSITVIRSEESNAQEFGGLVGRNAGRITSSFAESSFQFFGTGLPVTNLGGLVGYHSSKRIETSYAIADMSQITSDTIEAEKVGCFIGQSTIPNRGYNDVVGSYCVGDVPSGAYAFAGTNRLGGHELYGQSNLYDSDVEWNNSDPIALGVPTGVFSSEDLLSSLDPIWYFLTHLTYEVSSTGYPTLRDNQFD